MKRWATGLLTASNTMLAAALGLTPEEEDAVTDLLQRIAALEARIAALEAKLKVPPPLAEPLNTGIYTIRRLAIIRMKERMCLSPAPSSKLVIGGAWVKRSLTSTPANYRPQHLVGVAGEDPQCPRRPAPDRLHQFLVNRLGPGR